MCVCVCMCLGLCVCLFLCVCVGLFVYGSVDGYVSMYVLFSYDWANLVFEMNL